MVNKAEAWVCMKIKEGAMGPTGVPLMGELRKTFTRRLKSCPNVIRRFLTKVNPIALFLAFFFGMVCLLLAKHPVCANGFGAAARKAALIGCNR
jgi:hypothetical protein